MIYDRHHRREMYLSFRICVSYMKYIIAWCSKKFKRNLWKILYKIVKIWYNIICGWGDLLDRRCPYLPVAQLDSAWDSDSQGHRFESCRAGQSKTDSERDLSFLIPLRLSMANAGVCSIPLKICFVGLDQDVFLHQCICTGCNAWKLFRGGTAVDILEHHFTIQFNIRRKIGAKMFGK